MVLNALNFRDKFVYMKTVLYIYGRIVRGNCQMKRESNALPFIFSSDN